MRAVARPAEAVIALADAASIARRASESIRLALAEVADALVGAALRVRAAGRVRSAARGLAGPTHRIRTLPTAAFARARAGRSIGFARGRRAAGAGRADATAALGRRSARRAVRAAHGGAASPRVADAAAARRSEFAERALPEAGRRALSGAAFPAATRLGRGARPVRQARALTAPCRGRAVRRRVVATGAPTTRARVVAEDAVAAADSDDREQRERRVRAASARVSLRPGVRPSRAHRPARYHRPVPTRSTLVRGARLGSAP